MAKAPIGYTAEDQTQPFSKFYTTQFTPLSSVVTQALANPLTWGSLLDIDQLNALEADGYMETETGFCVDTDGSTMVAVKTDMPHVSPQMWDW